MHASNSVMIEGCTLTSVAVTLLIKVDSYQVFVAFIPLWVFWHLDAYFLWQERLYRKLYNWVITNTLGWFYGAIAILTLLFWLFDIALRK